MDIVWAADLSLGPPPVQTPPGAAIDADNTLTLNGNPMLLIQGTNMGYGLWYITAYTEAQADAMIQQALAAGVNVIEGLGIYPYTNPLYTGQYGIQVVNAKYGRSWMNASAGKPFGHTAANVAAVLATSGAQYRLVWNYFSEPEMANYASPTGELVNYRLIGQLDPSFPLICTEAIRSGTTHSTKGFFIVGGSVADGGYWDEVVQATGLAIPIVEFVQEPTSRKLWEFIYFMNRRARGVSMAAPMNSPTAAPGGAGALSGTYQFVYTWSYGTGYTDPDAVESFASPPSAPITVSGSTIVVSGLTGPVGTGRITLWGYKIGVSKSDGSWPTSGYAFIVGGLPSNTTSFTVTTDYTADFTTWLQATIPPRVAKLGWIPSISTTLQGELFGWNAITTTLPTTGTLTSGSAVVTGIPDTSLMGVGMTVYHANLPVGTQIASIDSGTQITLSQVATASGTAQPITMSFVPSFDQTSRWWWLQVAMNCRAFEWYWADWLRGPGGNDEPIVGSLSQTTKIAFASSDPSDTRACTFEGVLGDGVTIAREDNIILNGTTPVPTANFYSKGKWLASHLPTATFTVTGIVTSGSAVITGIPNTNILKAGMTISGPNIRAASLIQSVDSISQITITQTASGTPTPPATLTVGHAIKITEVATGNNVLVHNPTVTDPNKFAPLVIPTGNYKGQGLALFAAGNDGLPNRYKQLWDDTATVVGRVSAFGPVIIAPGQWQRIAAVSPAFVPVNDAATGVNPKGLYAAKKTTGGFLYVIAINWDQQNPLGYDRLLAGATIDVGQAIVSVVRTAGETGSPSFAGSVITDTFAPSQVHVYQIQTT